MSSNVVTVALGLVSRTEARHDGHVYGFGFEAETWDACHENHSFKHDPQKVCKQSSKVNGWNKISVHIFRGNVSFENQRVIDRNLQSKSTLSGDPVSLPALQLP